MDNFNKIKHNPTGKCDLMSETTLPGYVQRVQENKLMCTKYHIGR